MTILISTSGLPLLATSGLVMITGSSGGPFDPRTLFASGEVGAIGLFGTAYTTLYEEITGASATTVANADEQPVGTITCEYSTGNFAYFTVPSTSDRGTLDITGGLWSIIPAATINRRYTAPIPISNDELYLGVVINPLATQDAYERIISCGASGTNDFDSPERAAMLLRNATNEEFGTYRNGLLASAAVSNNAISIVESWIDASDSRVSVNEAAPSEVASALGNFAVTQVAIFSAAGTIGDHSDTPLYGFFLRNKVSDLATWQSDIRALLNAQGGL